MSGAHIDPNYLELNETALAQSTPAAANSIVYPKAGIWYQMGDDGVERPLYGAATVKDFNAQVSIANVRTYQFVKNIPQQISGVNYAVRAMPSPTLRRLDGLIMGSFVQRIDLSTTAPTLAGGAVIKNGRVMYEAITAASLNASNSVDYSGGRPHKPNSRYLTYLCARICTGTVLTSIRMNLGLSTALITSDAPTGQTAMLVSYSTANGDPGWVGELVRSDNTVARTASLAAMAATTDYVFEMWCRGSICYFAANYGTPVSLSSPDLSAETVLGTPCITVQTLNTTAKAIYMSGLLVADYEI